MSDQIRCPMCGRPNPAELDSCQYCQARLKPVMPASVPPFPEGSIPPGDTGGLPDWLIALRIAQSQKTGMLTPPPNMTPAEPPPAVQKPAPVKPAAPEPLPPAPVFSQPAPAQPDEGLDWLASLQQIGAAQPAAETASPPPPAPVQPEETPDWLSGLGKRKPDPAPTTPFESVDAVSDWLHRFDPPAPPKNEPDPIPTSTPAPAPSEEPDWLESIRRRSAAEVAGRSEPKPEPRLEPKPEAKPEIKPSAPPSGESDWLSSLRQPAQRAAPSEKPAASFSPAPADDWLSEFSANSSAPEPEPAPEPGLPDWLLSAPSYPVEDTPTAIPAAPAPPADEPLASFGSHAPAAAEPAEGIPEWMKSLEPLYPAPEMPQPKDALPPAPPQPNLAPPSAEFAEFLRNASRMDTPLPDAGFFTPALPEEPAAEEAGADLPGWSTGPAPDWLAALEAKAGSPPALEDNLPPAAAPKEPAANERSFSRPADPFISGALPDWLGELGTAERGSDQPAQPAPFMDLEGGDSLESAEMPSWVQALRPVETVAPKPPVRASTPAGTRIEDSGPLAGLRGILPAEVTIPSSFSRTQQISNQLEISEQQERHSQVLENLLASEEKAEEPAAAPVLSGQRILRMAIAAMLLVVLLIPLLTGLQIFPTPTAAPAEVSLFHDSLQTLPENAPVLLVADYSPAVTGEMQAAASGALTDLLLKGARITILSTSPAGPALGDHLLSSLVPAADPQYEGYRNGEKVVHLGYLPGGTTALAAFAANPSNAAPFSVDNTYAWEKPGLKDVRTVSDFARIIVLTENANTGQAWIEQVQPQLSENSKMLVIAGAQAAPALRPFLASHQVVGMLVGVPGGAAYEQVTGRPGVAGVYWSAFQFGTWAAVLIILVGGLSVFVGPALAAIRSSESAS